MTAIVPPPGAAAAARSRAAAVIDGVDVDAVEAAACGCAAVDGLCSGPWGGVVTYLPGRQVAGIRVATDHVVISVRGRWGFPLAELARQVQAAVRPLVASRRVDVVLADLAVDDEGVPAGAQGEEVAAWTTSRTAGGPGGSTSAPVIPTAAATPPPLPRA